MDARKKAEEIVEGCWGVGDEGGSEFYHYDLDDKIEAAILEAVAAEREACAKLADAVVALSADTVSAPMGTEEQRFIIGEAMKRTAENIATAIRNRKIEQ